MTDPKKVDTIPPDPILARMRSDAETIFRAGLSAADPATAIRCLCRREDERLWIGKDLFDLSTIERLLVEGAGKATVTLGYQPLILSSCIEGDSRTVARVHAAVVREVLASGSPLLPPACILSGGETTVVVKGDGGGRNQEFALVAAQDIAAKEAIVLLAADTDGTDGPTDAAGTFVDHTTAARAARAGLDIRRHLSNNDAYPFSRLWGTC